MTSNKAKEIIYHLKQSGNVPVINQVIWREYDGNNNLTEWTYQQLVDLSNFKDVFVDDVIAKFKERSEVGFKKYGTTLERNDLSLDDWMNHLQEELMDATLYISKLRHEINKIIPTFGSENDSRG